MSAIFHDVTLGWAGKEYTIKPTMLLLNRIEQKVSMTDLAMSLQTGAPKMSQVATAVAVMLQSAGVSVTDADVYVELMHGDQAAITQMAQAVLVAAFPIRPQSGNEEAPKTSTKKKK